MLNRIRLTLFERPWNLFLSAVGAIGVSWAGWREDERQLKFRLETALGRVSELEREVIVLRERSATAEKERAETMRRMLDDGRKREDFFAEAATGRPIYSEQKQLPPETDQSNARPARIDMREATRQYEARVNQYFNQFLEERNAAKN